MTRDPASDDASLWRWERRRLAQRPFFAGSRLREACLVASLVVAAAAPVPAVHAQSVSPHLQLRVYPRTPRQVLTNTVSATVVNFTPGAVPASIGARCPSDDGPYVLTALHAFSLGAAPGLLAQGPLRIQLTHASGQLLVNGGSVRLCSALPDRDVALIQIVADDGLRVPEFAALALRDGDINGAPGALQVQIGGETQRPLDPRTCAPSEVACGGSLFRNPPATSAIAFDLQRNHRSGMSGRAVLDARGQLIGVVVASDPVKVGGLLGIAISASALDGAAASAAWVLPELTEEGEDLAVAESTRLALASILQSLPDRCGPEWSNVVAAVDELESGSISWSSEGLNETFRRIRVRLSENGLAEERLLSAIPTSPCSVVDVARLRAALLTYLDALSLERAVGAYRTLWSLEPERPVHQRSEPAHDRLTIGVRTFATTQQLCRARGATLGWTSVTIQRAPPERPQQFLVEPTGARATCYLLAFGDDATPRSESDLAGAANALFVRPAAETPGRAIFGALQFAGVIAPMRTYEGADAAAMDTLWQLYRQQLGSHPWAELGGDVAQVWSLASLLSSPVADGLLQLLELFAIERHWSPELLDTMRERFALVGRGLPPPRGTPSATVAAAFHALGLAHSSLTSHLILRADGGTDEERVSRAARALIRYQITRAQLGSTEVQAERVAFQDGFATAEGHPFADPALVERDVADMVAAMQLALAAAERDLVEVVAEHE